jgi:hypothetical protein
MKIKLVNVKIHKEAGIIVIDKNIPMYEASILRLMYGEELVDIVGGDTGLVAEVTSPQDEYRRLFNLYGTDSARNAKRVELIFGFYETGQFEKAFTDSVVEDDIEDAEVVEELDQVLAEVFTNKSGGPYKREADLVNALVSDGLEGQYAIIKVEDGFIGNLS